MVPTAAVASHTGCTDWNEPDAGIMEEISRHILHEMCGCS